MNQEQPLQSPSFTSYQKFVIFLLTITQFTVVLDFMVMSPLGDIMMKTLKITTSQFSTAVSAYAFSAGISGLLTAGFADRFDRKKLLLFFYIGFAIGTLFCALAPNYWLLVLARIITGIFGGVIGSISMAIIADLFSYQQRGRVMSFVQMGFGASQILGIPIGLYIANHWGWHVPFLWIAILAGIIAFLLLLNLRPITTHLGLERDDSPFNHLSHIIFQKNHQIAFLSTATLSVGGFMMMPFGSAFAINNLKVSEAQLPMIFMASGIGVFIIMPLVGQLSDRVSKFKIFAISTLLAIVMINIYSQFSATSFYIVLVSNIIMMMAIMSRSIPISALTSAIPAPQDRGAFMSINISLQQMAGGFGAMLAGTIIVQKDNFAPLQNYDLLAFIASCIMLFSIYLVYIINNLVEKRQTMPVKALLVLGILTSLSSCNGFTTQINNANPLNISSKKGDTVQQLANNIMVVYQDSKNNYWFGSWESGLYHYNGKTILHYSTKNGLPHNRINDILEDKFGNLYFNTSAGISKFDGQNFVTLTETVSAKNEWKLQPDDLWFKCPQYSGQVYRYDGKNLYKLQMPTNKLGDELLSMRQNASSPYAVYCSYKDRKGNIWFGTAALGACRYNGKTFDWILEEDVTEIHDGPSNGVRSIIEDKDGYFWFNSMYRYDVYGKSVFKEKFYNRAIGVGSLDGKKDGDLYEYLSIAKDNNNELWIATYTTGVWRFDPSAALGDSKKNIIHYAVQEEGKDILLFSIYKDNQGTLWLGTHENGAFKFNGKEFERFKL